VRSLFDDISEYEKGFTDFVGQSQLSTIQHRAAQLIAQRTVHSAGIQIFFKEMFGSRFFLKETFQVMNKNHFMKSFDR
jgi:hypothetical protein